MQRMRRSKKEERMDLHSMMEMTVIQYNHFLGRMRRGG